MADDNLDELDARAKELANRSQEIQQSFSEIRSGLAAINKQLGRAGEEAVEFRRALNSVENTTSKLNQLQNQYLESNKGTRKVQDELAKSQVAASKLREAQAIAMQKMADARARGENLIAIKYGRQAINLKNAAKEAEGLNGMLGKMVKESEYLDENTKFFGQLSNVVKSIPGLKGFSEPFQRAEKSARSILADGGNATQAFKAGAKEFGTELNKFASATFVKGFLSISKNSSNLAKQLNTSTKDSLRIERSFRDIANSSDKTFITTEKLIAANASLNEQLGSAVAFSGQVLENFTALTKQLDISDQAAGGLLTLSATTGKNFEDQTKELIGQVEVYKRQTGFQVDNRAVLEDIGKLNKATLLTLEGQGHVLGSAVAETRRLGLNFQLLEGSAQSLLNFESSISNELEAELITGKEINLERARLAALTGDQVTLAKELSAQFGTAQDFQNMSVIAQESFAKSMGMTRNQLAEVLMQRDAINKYAVSDNEELQKQINDYIKVNGYQAAIAKYGEDQYTRQLANQSIQEKFNDTIVRLQSLVVSLVDGPIGGLLTALESSVNAVSSVFSFLSRGGEAAETLYGSIVKVAAFMTKLSTSAFKTTKSLLSMGKFGRTFAAGFRGIGKVVAQITKLASKLGLAGKVLGGFGKTLGKVFGVGVLKKIPGIGLIIGVMQAISRWQSGDKAGALMSLGSGVLSTIPGFGTAASLAVDAVDIATSKADFRKKDKDNREIEANDFTIRTHPKDTLVMAGGTQLGSSNEKTNELLERLLGAVEKGGDVYIDGNRAGKSLALATYRSS